MSISYTEQLREVRRELAYRERVFPRWVSERRMSARDADQRMNAMRAVAETLVPLARAEEPELPLAAQP